MERILHHLGWKNTCNYLDKLPMNWCRISSINSITSKFPSFDSPGEACHSTWWAMPVPPETSWVWRSAPSECTSPFATSFAVSTVSTSFHSFLQQLQSPSVGSFNNKKSTNIKIHVQKIYKIPHPKKISLATSASPAATWVGQLLHPQRYGYQAGYPIVPCCSLQMNPWHEKEPENLALYSCIHWFIHFFVYSSIYCYLTISLSIYVFIYSSIY